MAKCKICKTNIPDGTEYCSNCQERSNLQTNESYLDSLLNSVKNPVPATESIYKKKNLNDDNSNNYKSLETATEPVVKKTKAKDSFEDLNYQVDFGDIEDFDQFNLEDDLQDLQSDVVINDEELFGQDLSELFEDSNVRQDKPGTYQYSPETEAGVMQVNTTVTKDMTPSDEELYTSELQPEPDIPVTNEFYDTLNEEDTVPLADITDNFAPDAISEPQVEEEEADNGQEADEEQMAEEQMAEEDEFDPDLNELLNSLNLGNDDSEEAAEDEDKSADLHTKVKEQQKQSEDFEQIEPEEDDFLSLLNQISSDDPVAEDVKAINDLLSGKPVSNQNRTPSDVGEVFSDALKVVSSLNDPTLEELEALNSIPDKVDGKGKNKKQKKEKQKKEKKKGSKKGASDNGGQGKPKVGLLKRLFGNLPDENAAKKKEKDGKLALGEEAAATKEKTKKNKAAKGKKGAASTEDEESLEGGKGKADKAADKKESKKEKKEKKKKSKEIIQVIDEIDEDEGRINRIGASIVFVFFGLLVALLLVGTNFVSYTLSIQHATNYFKLQKYTQAYNEVYGIDIKDEDIEIYDKIMTVMFVNKQLNSYNNYYSIGEYPQALDSLLKGLKRYDKYTELATMLGIKTDLDYVRSQILAELDNVFNLSEKEAMKIIATDNMKEYSLEVYDVVLEKMND